MARRIQKIGFIVVLFVVIIAQYFFTVPLSHFAFAANYNITYDISYHIDDSGTANVDYDIVLTNLTDNLYAASQSLTLTQTDIYDVSVVSNNGVHQSYQLTKSDGATTITTTFTSPAIGRNSFNHWSVEYKTKQVATLSGGVWNILVPGFGDKESLNISDLHIHIVVPKSFGPANYTSPSPSSITDNGSTVSYLYNNDKINSAGVSLALGSASVYSFTFNYPVSNSSTDTQEYTIAVPIDTATQSVTFTKVDPRPDHFSINSDGDYVLSYDLSSHTSGALTVSGFASVSPIQTDFSKKFASPKQLPNAEQQALTQGMNYWEVTDPHIISLSASLTKGKTTNVDKARAIYDYLVKNFKYNRNALFDDNRQRKGALYAIQNPNDVICQEYVDAFVALARAAGIPAVFDAGYGNTASPLNTLPPNVLHAWVEFYDPNYGWISADPTWASTSGMDFWGNLGTSHFLLARYGYDSQNPVLVLAFSTRKDNADNIKLSPTSDAFMSNINFTTDATQNAVVETGITTQAHASVINTGNRVIKLTDSSLQYDTNNLPVISSQTDAIFPTMNGTVYYSARPNSFLARNTYKGTLTAIFADVNGNGAVKKTFAIDVLVTPSWYIALIPLLAVILIFVLSYTLVSLTIRLHSRFAKTESIN